MSCLTAAAQHAQPYSWNFGFCMRCQSACEAAQQLQVAQQASCPRDGSLIGLAGGVMWLTSAGNGDCCSAEVAHDVAVTLTLFGLRLCEGAFPSRHRQTWVTPVLAQEDKRQHAPPLARADCHVHTQHDFGKPELPYAWKPCVEQPGALATHNAQLESVNL